MPHALYAEEVQNFIGDFESFRPETRKFSVPLTIATQGIASLPSDDAASVCTDCGTLISFRVSGADALRLAGEFAMAIPAADLQNPPDCTFYVRRLKALERRAGTSASPTTPQSLNAYPPFGSAEHRASRESIIRTSGERWTEPRVQRELTARL